MAWGSAQNYIPLSAPTAASCQLTAWTCDATTVPATPGLSSGFIYFCRTYVDLNVASNNIYLAQIAAGTGMSNCYVGVYQAGIGGNRLAQTADLSTSLMQTAPPISAPWQFALTSTVSAMAINTEIWLAILLGAQTGTATWVGRSNYGTNIGMTSDYRMWMTNSGGNTSLPSTVPATISAAGGSQSMIFIGLGP